MNVGDKRVFTASFRDGSDNPVAGIDQSLITWQTEDPSIVSISDGDVSNVDGFQAQLTAVAPGVVVVTATYTPAGAPPQAPPTPEQTERLQGYYVPQYPVPVPPETQILTVTVSTIPVDHVDVS
jgi:hypothetical protein